MKSFHSINPYDLSVIAEHPLMSDQQLDEALHKSSRGYDRWKGLSFQQRSDLLRSIAIILRNKKEHFARTITLEMGKAIAEARSEIEKCALACEFFAGHGEEMMKSEMIETDARRSVVTFEPVGAVFAIMPWNFPFWQVIRAAAPSLMAGNVLLLKHAPNVCMCSRELEQLFREAGFPEGVFQSLIADIDVTEKIISHSVVGGVTLTGSEAAGSSVASLAGKHIKKSVLELGGSDPLIICDDADLKAASKVALQSRMQNAGQSCIAAKRFIVVERVRNDFLNHLVEGIKKLKQGNPLDETVTTGPLARIDLAEKVEEQQNASQQKGAMLLTGGTRNGCNFQPAILDHVMPGLPAFDEEVFGPVASVIHAKDENEAIDLANQTRFGLGASVWTGDTEKGEYMAGKIRAGNVYINALVHSDPRLPFGGIKKSGYGRELSKYGMHEFVNVKTVFTG